MIDGTLERVTAWHDYQERAGYYFYLLGMDVNVDEHVIGARGEHDVDVVVRASQAGIEQTWIVECKLWQRRVTKLHVAALANIVQDVGADRGILLSETGFQKGAIRLASFSNITLTSLTKLTDECCIHWGTVVKAGPGWLACTACGMVQPTDCEASLENSERLVTCCAHPVPTDCCPMARYVRPIEAGQGPPVTPKCEDAL